MPAAPVAENPPSTTSAGPVMLKAEMDSRFAVVDERFKDLLELIKSEGEKTRRYVSKNRAGPRHRPRVIRVPSETDRR